VGVREGEFGGEVRKRGRIHSPTSRLRDGGKRQIKDKMGERKGSRSTGVRKKKEGRAI